MKSKMLLPHPELYEKDEQIRAGFSFRPYIDFLQKRSQTSPKSPEFYRYIISRLEADPRLSNAEVDAEFVLGEHTDLLQLVIASLYTITASHDLDHVQLSIPYRMEIVHASHTDNMLYQHDDEGYLRFLDDADHERLLREHEFLAYRKILHKFYHFGLPGTFNKGATGGKAGSRYYREVIDESFIDVRCLSELPMFPSALKFSSIEEADLIKLRQQLPLSIFKFEGFLLRKISDITREQAIAEVKNALIEMHTDEAGGYVELREAAEAMISHQKASLSITPFIRLNSNYILSRPFAERSLLFTNLPKEDEQEQLYNRLGNLFRNDPSDISFHDIRDLSGNTLLERAVLSLPQRSYVIRPLYEHTVLLGFLELNHDGELETNMMMERINILAPYFLLALRSSIRDFHEKLANLVRENFTVIQPAVEWKFSENTWNYLRDKEKGKEAVLETVVFEDVYPIFGLVDIRNSSGERTRCTQRDLTDQLELIERTLVSMIPHVNGQEQDHLRNLLQKNQTMLTRIQDVLLAEDEMQVSEYLEHEIRSFFRHFCKGRHELEVAAKDYLRSVDLVNGYLYRHRRKFEESMAILNNLISKFLDNEDARQQKFFPHYFDKFKTDGIEYNIFVGASIAKGRPFDFIYLKNLRLWQLSAMAEITKTTEALIPQLSIPLQTTQLILAHSMPITITFRKDEKKFDVEGGANVRYELIKKRIDKVRVRESGERLTQPGTIAIVYTQAKEAEEYEEYIQILRKKNLLHDHSDRLDLEDVQGISGLKAIRVYVKAGK